MAELRNKLLVIRKLLKELLEEVVEFNKKRESYGDIQISLLYFCLDSYVKVNRIINELDKIYSKKKSKK